MWNYFLMLFKLLIVISNLHFTYSSLKLVQIWEIQKRESKCGFLTHHTVLFIISKLLDRRKDQIMFLNQTKEIIMHILRTCSIVSTICFIESFRRENPQKRQIEQYFGREWRCNILNEATCFIIRELQMRKINEVGSDWDTQNKSIVYDLRQRKTK